MKSFSTKAALAICALGLSVQAFAGNKDRSGQAGATELLINPWGASNGVFGLNTATVVGVEAMKGNIAGLAMADRTEVGFAYSMYLSGSKVGVSNLGFSQKLGNFGVLGVNIMSTSFGDIPITTYDNPSGGVGTYKPQFLNFQVGFAKEFSKYIRAGIAATFVNEQVSNVSASGAAFDAGVQYVTGARNNFHFSVALRNIGTNMRYSGGGFAVDAQAPASTYSMSVDVPSEKFEMPTYLNFGLAYDFYLDANHLKSEDDKPMHRLTAMGSFQSNSYNNDYLGLGAEYAFREMFMLRAGYRYEKNIGNSVESTTMFTGWSAGASVQYRVGNKGPRMAIDYAYRPTQKPNNGVHTFTLRMHFR
jgi:hypothetical protein